MKLHLNEKQCIQVALYMLNYTKKEILTQEIKKFLEGWIRDGMNQIECERLCHDHRHEFWVDAIPIKRQEK